MENGVAKTPFVFLHRSWFCPGVRPAPVHARPAQSSVLMYSATALTSSSVSFDATECMTSLSFVRSRVLKDFNCDSV